MRDKTIKDKIWHVIAILTFIMMTVFTVTYAFWKLYPYQVSDVKVPIEILNENNEIAVGETIQLELQLTKPNNLRPNGSVFITCKGGNLITLNGSPQDLPVGQYTVKNDRYILPNKVSVGGKCTFVFKNSYPVNPVREITKTWTSEEFTVVKE